MRMQIVIPAQGMIELRDALTDLLDQWGSEDHGQFSTDGAAAQWTLSGADARSVEPASLSSIFGRLCLLPFLLFLPCLVCGNEWSSSRVFSF